MAKLISHKMLGLAIAYYVLRPHTMVQALSYAGLALIGSITPDLDGLHKHRMLLHNLFSCLVTSLIIYFLLLTITRNLLPIEVDSIGSALAYLLAYMSHLIADIPTGNGVSLFYPFSKKKIYILGLKYDNIVYNSLLIILATLLLYDYFTSTTIVVV